MNAEVPTLGDEMEAERPREMRTQSSDTSLKMEQAQIEMLRKAPLTKRFALIESWSQFIIEAARQRIRRDDPEANEEEVALTLVARQYGQSIADGVRVRLARRKQQ
jgi:hypothetical protein